MFGAISKSYYAKLLNVDPSKIFVISVMPCLAKKAECAYPTMVDDQGSPEVDVSITNRELVRLIRLENLNPAEFPESEPDMPLGVGSGAGNIFRRDGRRHGGRSQKRLQLCHRRESRSRYLQ